MESFEQLGAFYLGKTLSLGPDPTPEELLLYDSKDLTTHALCVGMTGSGKTGLCLSLLEEAGIDGIPAIAVDPKGDLGNLLLTFPELQPDDFQPWVDPAAAAQHGTDVPHYAARVAQTWRDGLAEWRQDGDRIRRFRESVDLTIYTPGSNVGLPISILGSFAAPAPAVRQDADAFREQIATSTAGLLALLDIEADPVRSPEFILIARILEEAWTRGKDVDLPALIGEIQQPSFERIGVLEVDQFFPAKNRMQLAMTLNGLLASPTFAGWLEGESLDIQRLLYAPGGKPRISILSVAHLSERERMFFVTTLLNQLLAWMRAQPGTPSLRALFYMDEVFGYFPPVSEPPSKRPMLTLLKQARAYGLGIVLATQNPVDLDYRGLSNCGTWFLGRLQTQRDKERVLDGLEGASAQSGKTINRRQLDQLLSGLESRVFLMNNVHEDEPVVFQTRWALSYLRGPLTREQIKSLMADQKSQAARRAEASVAYQEVPAVQPAATAPVQTEPPTLPRGIRAYYMPVSAEASSGNDIIYHAALVGFAKLHFVRAGYQIDTWMDCCAITRAEEAPPDNAWEKAHVIRGRRPEWSKTPQAGASFAELTPALRKGANYARWSRQLRDWLYRQEQLVVWKCAPLKLYSHPGETEEEFRVRAAQAAREIRDQKREALRQRYGKRIAAARERVRRAEQRVSREQSQVTEKAMDTTLSFGATLIGALFGRKLATRRNIDRAASSARKGTRTAKEWADVRRAKKALQAEQEKLEAISRELQERLDDLKMSYHADTLPMESLLLKSTKKDLAVERVAVVWLPFSRSEGGELRPAYSVTGRHDDA